ncbi:MULTISPECIES: magnesium transporter [Vibrio]|uniref:Magnesium transporter n=2 Tax=Vibrio TaxID=662 RepID=A0A7X4LIJ9_9VIBR|nr:MULTISPECIES: magnesium transporter [Vibrio]MBF8999250.1 magnesium transporter [Vibrio nitrifigilis]MZI92579.1 magnesium transporter [Vibrio eleionomae]
MTVMNNHCMNNAKPFSIDEIGAARNAFLQYEPVKQVELLSVMPTDEAVGILSHCSITHVQDLLCDLDAQGHKTLAHQYAKQLGMVYAERKPIGRSDSEQKEERDELSIWHRVKQRVGWVIPVALVGVVSGIFIY